MIGRRSDLLSTSTKPASVNAEAMPVKLETLGRLLSFASIGYPSTIFAPCSLAYSTAALSNLTISPWCLKGFATKKQTIDQAGLSSTLFKVRDRSSEGNASLGATEHHAMGCPPA